MRLGGVVAAGVLVAAAAGLSQTAVGDLHHVALSPAYDTVTQTNMAQLARAAQSYAIAEGPLDELETSGGAGLAGWGWEPTGTTSVLLVVDGDDYCILARDVRPASSTFHVSSREGHDHASDVRRPGDEPGLVVVHGDVPG